MNHQNENETKKIKEFNWLDVPMSATWITIGPPESGKTFFMQFMLYALKHKYPVATAVCGTEGSQGAFTPILGPLYVESNYSEESQIRHAKRQKYCIRDGVIPWSINIVDDCSDDTSIYNTKIILGSFKNGRQHWKRQFVVGLQYALDMKPAIRKSVSFVVLFREPEETERKKIYDNFGGSCGSYKNFCNLMDAFTGDHQCLIIKKCAQSNELEDIVFWFKAPCWKWEKDGKLHPYPEGWTFGCKEYKDWHYDRYNKNYEEPIV